MTSNGAQPLGRRESAGDKQVFTTGEAARICNVSQQTIIRCFDRGRLSGFRVPGSKFRRIPRAELARFMQDNDIPLDRLNAGRTRVLMIGREVGSMAGAAAKLREDSRFDVRVAESPFDAGFEAGAFRPDVVIVGPGFAGVDAARVSERLRSFEETAGARALEGHEGTCRSRDAIDLTMDARTLGDRLRALLGGESAEGAG